jgi:hypothetical protein
MAAEDLELDDGERERVAERLRRVREQVRDRALISGDRSSPLPETRPVATVDRLEPHPVPAPPPPPPERPDASEINRLWQVQPTRELRGIRGLLGRLLRGLLGPSFEAQVAFNSRQVQLDNAVLEYIDARLARTHAHYDGVLGGYGRHLGETDERHMILQEELVAHVHDLVKRIDLVLSEAERGRLGIEFALSEVRARLLRLEEGRKAG